MYIDESGCTGALAVLQDGSVEPKVQPLHCLVGLILDLDDLSSITQRWISAKEKYFDGQKVDSWKRLDWMTVEVKGSEVRKASRSNSRRKRRWSYIFIDECFTILEQHRARLLARVHLKDPGVTIDGTALYTRATQDLCTGFQQFLDARDANGIVIADSRNKQKDRIVSHSVFTQKHRRSGDRLPSIIETTLFGRSDNHAGLQMSDFIASGVLFPLFGSFFLLNQFTNQHVHPAYLRLGPLFAHRLKALQFRYDGSSIWGQSNRAGGIAVSNPVTKRGAGALFRHFADEAVE